jgi:hypothetical protein
MRALRAFTIAVLSLGLLAAACGGGGESPAQAKANITTAWQNFFDPTISVSQKADIIENYAKLKATLQAQSSSAAAQGLKAKVNKIVLNGSTAVVTYDLVSTKDGTALLPNAQGDAIKQGGHWKVSQKTFCALLALGGSKCPT